MKLDGLLFTSVPSNRCKFPLLPPIGHVADESHALTLTKWQKPSPPKLLSIMITPRGAIRLPVIPKRARAKFITALPPRIFVCCDAAARINACPAKLYIYIMYRTSAA